MKAKDGLVLFVDDDPDDRFLFQQAWEQAGGGDPLLSLEGGQQALDYLEGAGECSDRARFPRPILVLLDIKMPGKSGLEVLARLRAAGSPLPVIMLTASTSPRDVAEAFRLGANSFLVKPSSLGELVELLRALKGYWLRFNEFPP